MITNTTRNTNYYNIDNKNNIFDICESRVFAKDFGSTVLLPYSCFDHTFIHNGFTKTVADKYPIVKENFDILSKQRTLGKAQFIEVLKDKKYGHSLILVNMICQRNNKSRRKINYASLAYCMMSVKNKFEQLKKDPEISKVEIHCPKFGTGIVGGNWTFISCLIDDLWNKIDTCVYFNSKK